MSAVWLARAEATWCTTPCRSGARGVILNQPMPHAPTLPASLTAGTDGNQTTRGGRSSPSRVGSSGGGGGHEAAGAALKHFLGGPVGMPGAEAGHGQQLMRTGACTAAMHGCAVPHGSCALHFGIFH